MSIKRRSRNYYVQGMFFGISLTVMVLGVSLLVASYVLDQKALETVRSEENGTIRVHNDLVLTFEDDLKDELRQLWDSHNDSEYSACIKGSERSIINESENKYEDVLYTLKEVVKVNNGGENYVDQVLCFDDAIIHNHPKSGCSNYLWTGDVDGAKSAFARGVSFYLIQCERNKIEVYSRDNMWKGQIIELS